MKEQSLNLGRPVPQGVSPFRAMAGRWSAAMTGGMRREATAGRAQSPGYLSALNGLLASGRAQIGESHDATGGTRLPHGTDWWWRPGLWHAGTAFAEGPSPASGTHLGPDVSIFHDSGGAGISIDRPLLAGGTLPAQGGIRMAIGAFDGAFLSLVVDLPKDVLRDLTREHLVRLDTVMETSRPLCVYARLNIRHGPNTEQMVRSLPAAPESAMVEFDLAYSRINEKRLESAWIDLIFDEPCESEVILRELTVGRRRRAAF